MTADHEDPRSQDSVLGRLHRLEAHVNRLIESQTIEARDFVVVDEHGHPRARFEMAGHSPQLVFFDHSGRERLRIGLHQDGTPSMWVEGRAVPLVFPQRRE
jgi:hypothetical protein